MELFEKAIDWVREIPAWIWFVAAILSFIFFGAVISSPEIVFGFMAFIALVGVLYVVSVISIASFIELVKRLFEWSKKEKR